MFNFVIYLALILTGLCMGSFAGATVWRLRARQLVSDRLEGEVVDKTEYRKLNKLNKGSILSDHSRCLNCSYFLKWYDLIPLVSWLTLGGKCRSCRKPIGIMEPAVELSMMLFFVFSYTFWPSQLNNVYGVAIFILWLLAGVGLAILFIYDTKWFLLPDVVNFTIVGVGVINSILILYTSSNKLYTIQSIAASVFVLSGIYLILYAVSSGRWIGFGDVKLGLGLGLLIVDWKLAVVALMAANILGCLIVIPLMMVGKLNRSSRVPFGPMLIAGFVFAGLFGRFVVEYYCTLLV